MEGTSPDRLESELGVLQHHDSITGTEKQAVNDDYRIRLNRGMSTAALPHLRHSYALRHKACEAFSHHVIEISDHP